MKYLKTYESIFDLFLEQVSKYKVNDYVLGYKDDYNFYRIDFIKTPLASKIISIDHTSIGSISKLSKLSKRKGYNYINLRKEYHYISLLSNGEKINMTENKIIRKLTKKEIKQFELESESNKYNI